MKSEIYDAIISHANTNIKTGGISLFNELEKIDFAMSEIPSVKYSEIELLEKRKESIILIYAKKNNLM